MQDGVRKDGYGTEYGADVFGAKMGLDTRGQNLRINGFWGPTCRIGRIPGRALGRGTRMLLAGPGPAAGCIGGATPQGGSAHSFMLRDLLGHAAGSLGMHQGECSGGGLCQSTVKGRGFVPQGSKNGIDEDKTAAREEARWRSPSRRA